MTICAAGINYDGNIIVCSDFRITYKSEIKHDDSLLKTYTLGDFSTISLAGDVWCHQFIKKGIDGNKYQYSDSDEEILKKITFDLKELYEKYISSYKASDEKPFVQFLLASNYKNPVLVSISSPDFNFEPLKDWNKSLVIGGKPEVRSYLKKAMDHTLQSHQRTNYKEKNMPSNAGLLVTMHIGNTTFDQLPHFNSELQLNIFYAELQTYVTSLKEKYREGIGHLFSDFRIYKGKSVLINSWQFGFDNNFNFEVKYDEIKSKFIIIDHANNNKIEINELNNHKKTYKLINI